MAFAGEARNVLNESNDQAQLLTEVMKNIFSNCDTDQRGVVSVSKLLDFIRPFLTENLEALQDLKIVLDPNNLNPCVDAETFYKALSEWSARLSAGGDDDFQNVTPRDLNVMDDRSFPFCQSTPRSSLGNSFLRNYVESGTLNLSNVSTYSWAGNNTNGGVDRVYLEEQIHELEHQKKKLGEELERVRQELTIALDTNEVFQLDVHCLKKKLATDQKIIDQLQTERKKDEDMEEALNSSQKNVAKLKKILSTLEKTNMLLSKNLDEADAEKRKLEQKITQINKVHEESTEAIVALQTELTFKDQVVASLEDLTNTLRRSINEHQDTNEQNNLNIEKLRVEKSTLEKLLRERVAKHNFLFKANTSNRSSSFSDYSRITRGVLEKKAQANDPVATEAKSLVPFVPKIETERFAFYNYDSPLARNRQRAMSFNSPRLLHMLEAPVSPHMQSPTLSSSRCSKRSVDSDDYVDGELLGSTSTPDIPKQLGKQSSDIVKQILEIVIENVANICHNSAIFLDTLPIMYILERTGAAAKKVSTDNAASKVCQNDNLDQITSDGNNNNSLPLENRLVVSPNVSNHSSESADDEMFYKMQLMANSENQCFSLQTEFNQVIGKEHADHQCDHYIKLVEYEEKILSLQCELMQQQSSNSAIENRKLDMNQLKRNNDEYRNKIANLLADVSRLENQLLLSRSAEQNLHSKFKSLQNSLKSSTTYITEVRIKISEYDELEARCKVLEEKISTLESENETKTWRIRELNEDIETLRRKADLNTDVGDSSMRLLNLEKAKGALELESKEYANKIVCLEREKTALQKEKVDALEKLFKLEKERSDSFLEYFSESDSTLENFQTCVKIEDATKISNLEAQNSSLEIENGKLKLKLVAEKQALKQLKDIEQQKLALESECDIIKEEKRCLELDLETVQAEHESFQVKCSDLQSQLETAVKEKLEAKTNFDELLLEYTAMSTENAKLQNLESELRRTQNMHGVLKVQYDIFRQSSVEDYCKLEQKCDTLSRQNSTLSDSMSSLNNKIQPISKENGEIADLFANEETNVKNERLAYNFPESQTICENLQLQVDTLTLEKTLCDDSIKRKNDQILELENKITNLNNEIGKIANTSANKEEKLYQISIKEKFSSCLHELLNKQIQELKNITESNTNEFNHMKAKLEMANSNNEQLCEKINELQDSKRQLEIQFTQELKGKEYIYDKFINIENELFLSNSRVDRTQKECTKLIDDLRQKEQELNVLEEKNKNLCHDSFEVENLNKRVASLVQDNFELSREKQQLILACEKFDIDTKKMVQVQEENIELKCTINKITAEQQLNIMAENFCKNCKALEGKSPKKLSFDKLSLKTLKLEQKIEYLDEQLDNEKRRNRSFVHENKKLFEENSKLVNSIEINQAEISTIRSTLQQTADCLCKEKTRNDELEMTNKNVMSEIKKINEDNDMLRLKLRHLQNQPTDTCTNQTTYSRLRPIDVQYSPGEQKSYAIQNDVENLKSKLINSEINLRNVEDKLRKEEEKVNSVLVHIDVVKQRLFERKLRLGKSTLNAVGTWQSTLQKFSKEENFLETVGLETPVSPVWSFTGPLDEEMFQLKHQVHMSSMLLDNFTAMKKVSLQTSDAAVQTSPVECINLDEQSSRRSKIFALKPATLIVRSASPDSPSAEIFSKFGTPKSNIVFKKSPSPDSAGDNFPGRSGILHGENINDERSHSISEYFDTIGDINPTNFESVSLQDVSPNINRVMSEELGHLGDNTSVKDLSEEELEEKCMTLVMAFALDSSTLKDRCTKQITTLSEKENSFAMEISNLEYSLKTQRLSSVKETFAKACAQVSVAASRYGALKHEEQQGNAVDLLVKYVTILQQKFQKMISAQPCSSLQPYKGNDFVTKSSIDDDHKPDLFGNRGKLDNLDKSKSNKEWYCLLVSIIVIIFFGFTYLNMANWNSWDERCSPFLKIERYGRPPI